MQTLKFYTYDQNNSGGTFHFDADKGISVKVIVQALDAEEANFRAKRIGLYFDGSGDCSCCGDRWYEQWGDSGFDTPMIYQGCTIRDWMSGQHFMKWMEPDQPELFIHLYDDQFMGFVYGERGNLRIMENPEIEAKFYWLQSAVTPELES